MTDPSPRLFSRWSGTWAHWSEWLRQSQSTLGAIERDQMRRFLKRWSGKRGWLQFALVVGWNTLVAVGIASWTTKLNREPDRRTIFQSRYTGADRREFNI